METLKALIIDDEDHCRSSLNKQLEWSCPNVKVIGEANSAVNAKELIIKSDPDIAFLDIEMPRGTGFDLLKSLEEIPFKVIFTTAYDEYALDAFKVNAVAYLLKPIDGEELNTVIEKISLEKNDMLGKKLENLMNYLVQKDQVKKVAFPVSDGLQFVLLDTIIRCEADGNYCKIFLHGRKNLMISKTIKHINEIINHSKFVRVHQSHIINMDYVQKYIRGKNGQIVLDDGTVIPISRSKKDSFLDRI